MARHEIRRNGKVVRDGSGRSLFWSDSDGDKPNEQTVYARVRGFFGGSRKTDMVYDPRTGEFKKKR